MKQFLAFVVKEFDHILRDTWTMVILLILPIVMLILFGYALSTEVKNTEMVVFDPSRDSATEAITQRLGSNKYFHITQIISDPSQVDQVFRQTKTGLVVVFSANFYTNLLQTGEAQIQLLADATDPNTAVTLTNYATAIINGYQQELFGNKTIPYRINVTPKFLYNPEMRSSFTFVPGVMGMVIMLICAMMTSIAIAKEKENGTMEILLVSPLNPLLIILSKTVPYFVLSTINLITILLLAVFMLGVPMAGSLALLIGVSLVYIFVSLSLGLLISSIAETQMVALLISGMALMMPVMYLSGMMFPVENMPWALQLVSQIIPAKWYIIAVKKIMIKGLGVESILQESGVLILMAVILVTASLKKFKIRLE